MFDLSNVSHFTAASEVLYLTVYNNYKGKSKSKQADPMLSGWWASVRPIQRPMTV